MDKKIIDFQKFKEVFQDVLDIKDLKDWQTLRQILMKKVSEEDFSQYDKNKEYTWILTHTLNVLYCIQNDNRFKEMNERSQEILLWTALFHDCAKTAPPEAKSQDGRDPAHPFRSCHKTLLYLDSQIQLWNHLFQQAFQQQLSKGCLFEVHNMNTMPKIILFLEKQVSSFYSTILKLILMHQCIPCVLYPPVSPIELIETSLYFNAEELILLEVFWFNDSYSYCHTQEEEFLFGKEIKEKVDDAKKYLHKHVEERCKITLN